MQRNSIVGTDVTGKRPLFNPTSDQFFPEVFLQQQPPKRKPMPELNCKRSPILSQEPLSENEVLVMSVEKKLCHDNLPITANITPLKYLTKGRLTKGHWE